MRQEEQQAIDEEVRKRAEEQATAEQEAKQQAEKQKAEEMAARKRQDEIDQDEMMDLAVSQIIKKDKICKEARGLFDDFIVAVDADGKIVEEKPSISTKTQKEQDQEDNARVAQALQDVEDQEELDRACVEAMEIEEGEIVETDELDPVERQVIEEAIRELLSSQRMIDDVRRGELRHKSEGLDLLTFLRESAERKRKRDEEES